MHLESITAGEIHFDGQDITHLSPKEMRSVRPKMQMVFQDPYSSLNPRKTVEDALAEILSVHHIVPPEEIGGEIDRLLQLIGLNPDAKRRFPYEFSGGQRQRISVAKALTLRPKFLICDEATSALDVSIQAQLLNLFQELRYKMGLTYLFISHGLGAVKYISDRIAVMYLGKVVELAKTELIFSSPLHPIPRRSSVLTRILTRGNVIGNGSFCRETSQSRPIRPPAADSVLAAPTPSPSVQSVFRS